MTSRLPPDLTPGQDPQKKPAEPKKIYSRMSKIGSGFYRENPVYCLCYSCSEILINDTVVNTLLCPKCPSAQPMMNFPSFDRAMEESARSVEMKRRRLQKGIGGVDGPPDPPADRNNPGDMGGMGCPPTR